MALTSEELSQLGSFIKTEVGNAAADLRRELTPREPTPDELSAQRVGVVGAPEIDPEAGPLFYVHLANGQVVESHDSSSTHVAGDDGTTQLVIGRYQVGE